MYRFVALARDAADGQADADVRRLAGELFGGVGGRWQAAFRDEGLEVWEAGAHPARMQGCPLEGGRGVVVGQLFRKSAGSAPTPRIRRLDSSESERCVATGGRHLADHYWGRYVAFLRDPEAARLRVMRDPGAAFPCLHTRHGGVDIFCSDIGDLAGLPFLRFTVNYDYFRASVMLPGMVRGMTGLNGVREILPAESAAFPGGESEYVWDPFAVAADRPLTDRAEAAALLRETVRGAVATLAGCYDRILHNIGGLDSSIVLSCLAAAEGPPVSCVNVVTASPGGDESFYCRQAAERAGVELDEVPLDTAAVDLARLSEGGFRAAPMAMFDCTAPATDLYGHAERKRADALFYGVGGDNIFFQLPYILSALDYARIGRGRGRDRFGRVVAEAARYGSKSFAHVLRAMLAERLWPEPCFPYVYRLIAPTNLWPLANPELVAAGPPVAALHPLLVPEPGMAKGKYYHLLTSALFSPDYYDQWQEDASAEGVHPLLAQPVVELALRIPTWVLVHGGVDRGLVRLAFQGDLPPAVARRTSKSNPEELYDEVYRRNQPLIRQVLPEGRLVSEHILARKALESMLNDENPLERSTPMSALEFLNWEMWIQRWADRARS